MTKLFGSNVRVSLDGTLFFCGDRETDNNNNNNNNNNSLTANGLSPGGSGYFTFKLRQTY
jgi:hypothetical protein